MPPQGDEFLHPQGEAARWRQGLGQVGHLFTYRCRQFAMGSQPLTKQSHLAAGVGNDAEDRLDQRALARPVRSDQGCVGLSLEAEADPVDHRRAVTAHAQLADFENAFRHEGTIGKAPRAHCSCR